jgi:hypothetical protein
LRQDAAERAFQTELSKHPALAAAAHHLKVAVSAHPLEGTLVTISLTAPASTDATALVAAIDGLMSRYSFAYVVKLAAAGE